MIVLPLKQAGRHGRAGADGLRVNHPALHPIGFQAAAGLQEIGSGGDAIMSGIAGGVALEAGRGGAAEETARHLGFLALSTGISSGM